jgi:hypothetical protein
MNVYSILLEREERENSAPKRNQIYNIASNLKYLSSHAVMLNGIEEQESASTIRQTNCSMSSFFVL